MLNIPLKEYVQSRPMGLGVGGLNNPIENTVGIRLCGLNHKLKAGLDYADSKGCHLAVYPLAKLVFTLGGRCQHKCFTSVASGGNFCIITACTVKLLQPILTGYPILCRPQRLGLVLMARQLRQVQLPYMCTLPA